MSDGTVERDGRWITLHYERELRHPVAVVWRALTEPAEAGAWFGGKVEVELRVGGEYVTYHETGDRVVDRIVRLEPPRLLEHTFWVHLNPDALVTYELEEAPGGCRLSLTHRLTVEDLERAAAAYGWDDPMAQVPKTAAGWHRLLDLLEQALDGSAGAAGEASSAVASTAREGGAPPIDMPALIARYAAQLTD